MTQDQALHDVDDKYVRPGAPLGTHLCFFHLSFPKYLRKDNAPFAGSKSRKSLSNFLIMYTGYLNIGKSLSWNNTFYSRGRARNPIYSVLFWTKSIDLSVVKLKNSLTHSLTYSWNMTWYIHSCNLLARSHRGPRQSIPLHQEIDMLLLLSFLFFAASSSASWAWASARSCAARKRRASLSLSRERELTSITYIFCTWLRQLFHTGTSMGKLDLDNRRFWFLLVFSKLLV